MTPAELDAALALAVLAALADGDRSSEERDLIAKVGTRLGASGTGELVTRAGRGDLTPAAAAAVLASPEARRTAHEIAVSVVYADGAANAQETAFLAALGAALGEGTPGAADTEAMARGLGTASLAGGLPGTAAPAQEGPHPSQAGIPALTHDAALDELILRQALLAGALELLPQGLASLAIIPIQLRLVYRIGADYGQKLDAAQAKDLLGAMGIGAAAQVLDGMARRMLGGIGRGVLGRVLGGVVGGAAGLAVGAGVSFVTTYALGHAARQYYAQGRSLSGADLRALFERFRAEGEALLPKLQEEIHVQAQRVDLPRLLGTLRGS
jgi:uncharacterized protein (DUF697 family)/tellurite resistance protein